MERIVGAAEDLIRKEGVDRLNMRSLAARLGVQAPSLYTYFDKLEDVEALALDRIVAGIRIPDLARPEPPAEQLIDLFVALRDLVRSASATLISAPGSLTWRWNTRCFNQLLGFYYAMGADRDHAMFTHRVLWAFALDSVARDHRFETREQQIAHDRAEMKHLEKLPAAEAQWVLEAYRHRPIFGYATEEGLRERLRMTIAYFLPAALRA